jgi:hypothetical protein
MSFNALSFILYSALYHCIWIRVCCANMHIELFICSIALLYGWNCVIFFIIMFVFTLPLILCRIMDGSSGYRSFSTVWKVFNNFLCRNFSITMKMFFMMNYSAAKIYFGSKSKKICLTMHGRYLKNKSFNHFKNTSAEKSFKFLDSSPWW